LPFLLLGRRFLHDFLQLFLRILEDNLLLLCVPGTHTNAYLLELLLFLLLFRCLCIFSEVEVPTDGEFLLLFWTGYFRRGELPLLRWVLGLGRKGLTARGADPLTLQ
jgi:hypothetical protein